MEGGFVGVDGEGFLDFGKVGGDALALLAVDGEGHGVGLDGEFDGDVLVDGDGAGVVFVGTCDDAAVDAELGGVEFPVEDDFFDAVAEAEVGGVGHGDDFEEDGRGVPAIGGDVLFGLEDNGGAVFVGGVAAHGGEEFAGRDVGEEGLGGRLGGGGFIGDLGEVELAGFEVHAVVEVAEEGAAEEHAGTFADGVGEDGAFDILDFELGEADGFEVHEVAVDLFAVGDHHVDDGVIGAGGHVEFAGDGGGDEDGGGTGIDDHAAGDFAVEGDVDAGDAAVEVELDDGLLDAGEVFADEGEALGKGGGGAEAEVELGGVA